MRDLATLISAFKHYDCYHLYPKSVCFALCDKVCDINYHTPYQTVNKEAIRGAVTYLLWKRGPNVMSF